MSEINPDRALVTRASVEHILEITPDLTYISESLNVLDPDQLLEEEEARHGQFLISLLDIYI